MFAGCFSYKAIVGLVLGMVATLCLVDVDAADQAALPPDKPIQQYSPDEITRALNWHWQADANICHGYYQVPGIFRKQLDLAPMSESQTDVAADKPSTFSRTGTSVLVGNVVAKQKARRLHARKAYVDHCPDHQAICKLRLVGPFSAEEPGLRIVGERATINFKANRTEMNHTFYRLQNQENAFSRSDAWGSADKMVQDQKGVIDLTNATYSTCQPGYSAWHIHARHLELNDNTNRGTATNAWLDFYGVPLLYTPYFSFPIEKERETGFLMPQFHQSSRNGYVFKFPFYANLAPNYDATLTPEWLSRRGFKLNNNFRYLTSRSEGKAELDYMFNDDAFAAFRRQELRAGGRISNPSFRRLVNADKDRYYASLNHTTKFNDDLQMDVKLNYASDDYYFQDFKQGLAGASESHLLNRARLDYDKQNWDSSLTVQYYQTLHPLNESHNNDKYSRLPDARLNGTYYDLPYNLELDWQNQFVYFDHAQTFNQGDPFPTGLRFYSGPELSWPHRHNAYFITPSVKLNAQGYQLFTPTADNDKTTGHVIPSFSLDSGLYFVRRMQLTTKPYQQTLEPRLYYLYTPFIDQSRQPNFDTTLPTFGFNNLFRKNRFVGVDRISDANRIGWGLVSRVLDPYTGDELFNAKFGQIVHFTDRHVCGGGTCDLTGSDRDRNLRNASPIVGAFNYHVTSHWQAGGQIAWEPKYDIIDNASAKLNYQDENNRVIDINYNFVYQDDSFDGAPKGDPRNNFNRIQLGAAWPIYGGWHAIGHINYNISHDWNENYYYGVEYNSCCWSARLMTSETLLSLRDKQRQYDRDIFFQLQFKGLGNIENKNPHELLEDGLSGFNDIFGED